jgi:hypothetical protein
MRTLLIRLVLITSWGYMCSRAQTVAARPGAEQRVKTDKPSDSATQAKTFAETVKLWAEAAAYAGAAGFFLYKAFSGYLISNLTLSLTCQREHSKQQGTDFLVVMATIKKGDRGAVSLHDSRAAVSYGEPIREYSKELSGTNRLSFASKRDGIRRLSDKSSKKTPLLNLPPGEETQFSTYFEVPVGVPCTVVVTLLGGWSAHGRTAYQWRASQVSLPVRENMEESASQTT